MKKHFLFSYFVILHFCFIYSQTKIQTSEPFDKTPSITQAKIYDIERSDNFILHHYTGMTVNNKKSELVLYNEKALIPIKSISFPQYSGFDEFEIATTIKSDDWKSIIPLKDGIMSLYSSILPSGKTAIAASLIKHDLTFPEKPKYLFSIERGTGILGRYAMTNGAKDLCVFSYSKNLKKSDNTLFFYKIFDNNLNTLHSDSIEVNPKDTVTVLPYDKGVILINENNTKCELSVIDAKTHNTSSFEIMNEGMNLTFYQSTLVSDNLLVITGELATKTEFVPIKIIYDFKTNSIEKFIRCEHFVSGKYEAFRDIRKTIRSVIIAETGDCFFVVKQLTKSKGVNALNGAKFDLMCINSSNTCWTKQLPVPNPEGNDIGVAYSKNRLKLLYLDSESDYSKINYSNFDHGNPLPHYQGTSPDYDIYNISILSVDSKGGISHEGFLKKRFQKGVSVGDDFLAVGFGNKTGRKYDIQLMKFIFN